MIYQRLQSDLNRVLSELGFKVDSVDLSIPDSSQFGDYSTNIALQLMKLPAKKRYESVREIAQEIIDKLSHPEYLETVEVAGPGFINFYIKDNELLKSLRSSNTDSKERERKTKENSYKSPSRKFLVEYAQPNTHKAFHIGHLRNITIGESVSRILESQGHEVYRATYGGDIGPHVAKAIWGLLQLKDDYIKIKDSDIQAKSVFLGKAYVLGSTEYESSPNVKSEIDEINRKIYQRESELLPLWTETKQWSIDSFTKLYDRLGTKFDHMFWESEVDKEGKLIVEENIGRVFIEDEGAIIFPGEKYGLHNRVFITSRGTPTYEAKEIGLTYLEDRFFPFDQSLHIVANEQSGYFEVLIKALEMLDSSFLGRKRHISYGMVNLTTGKMSSRTGDVITAESLISQVKEKIAAIMHQSNLQRDEEIIEKVAIGAIKFSMLKYSTASDITFNIEDSISLHGDSGPYIQYSYARTQSLLKKSKDLTLANELIDNKQREDKNILEEEERLILRELEYIEIIIKKTALELNPTILCQYLLNLSRAFNLFYQKYPILLSEKQEFRVAITKKVGESLQRGLYLLGIEAPERM